MCDVVSDVVAAAQEGVGNGPAVAISFAPDSAATLRSGRRRAATIAALSCLIAASAVSGCAAGQVAQTAEEKPAVDGANVSVGSIDLRGLAIQAPSGNFYASGSSASLTGVIVNSGRSADTLTAITSSAIGGWGATTGSAGTSSQTVAVAPGNRVAYGIPTSTGSLKVTQLTRKVYPGSTVKMTFAFRRAGSVVAYVPVSLSARPASSIIPEKSGGADS